MSSLQRRHASRRMVASSAPLAMLRDASRRPAGDGWLLSMRAELFGGSHLLTSPGGLPQRSSSLRESKERGASAARQARFRFAIPLRACRAGRFFVAALLTLTLARQSLPLRRGVF